MSKKANEELNDIIEQVKGLSPDQKNAFLFLYLGGMTSQFEFNQVNKKGVLTALNMAFKHAKDS